MLGFIFSLRFSLMCRTIKGIMNKNFKLYLPSRPRRLRRSAAILDLCAENRICPKDLILPVFIQEGLKGSKEIPSMPNIHRHTIDSLLHYCEAALKADIKAIAPFPMVDAADKSLDAREAFNPMSLANRAIAAVKRRFPEMLVVADAALDPYTSHGHDGILDDSGTWIINDQTVAILCQMAVSAAEAGADVIAPSDMMDGHANLKYKFGNRHFWSEGYYVSTVGLNDATVAKYIREQEMHDIAMDKMSVKEYANPFSEAEQQAYKQEKAKKKK